MSLAINPVAYLLDALNVAGKSEFDHFVSNEFK
jgi:hypothetical protein